MTEKRKVEELYEELNDETSEHSDSDRKVNEENEPSQKFAKSNEIIGDILGSFLSDIEGLVLLLFLYTNDEKCLGAVTSIFHDTQKYMEDMSKIHEESHQMLTSLNFEIRNLEETRFAALEHCQRLRLVFFFCIVKFLINFSKKCSKDVTNAISSTDLNDN